MIARLPSTGVGRSWKGWALAALAAAGLAVAPTTKALAAPSADLWDRWTAHDAGSTQTVDHGAWDGLLKKYVSQRSDGVAVVDYGALKQTDRAALDAYVKQLEATPVSTLNRQEQFAYWVNFYNALTVKVIVDNYPTRGIRDIDISPGFFADGPWGAKLATVEGESVSLDDMEHRILRPIWKDPRIHYAVNCASISCPNLQTAAFTAQNTEALLNRGAREYVNDPRGVVAQGGRLNVSSIYEWFQADFGGSDAGVIAHLKQYADADLKAQLSRARRISDDDYDWSLNDVKAKPQPSPLAFRRSFSSGAPSNSGS